MNESSSNNTPTKKTLGLPSIPSDACPQNVDLLQNLHKEIQKEHYNQKLRRMHSRQLKRSNKYKSATMFDIVSRSSQHDQSISELNHGQTSKENSSGIFELCCGKRDKDDFDEEYQQIAPLVLKPEKKKFNKEQSPFPKKVRFATTEDESEQDSMVLDKTAIAKKKQNCFTQFVDDSSDDDQDYSKFL